MKGEDANFLFLTLYLCRCDRIFVARLAELELHIVQSSARKRGYTLCGSLILPYEGEVDPKRIAFEKLL